MNFVRTYASPFANEVFSKKLRWRRMGRRGSSVNCVSPIPIIVKSENMFTIRQGKLPTAAGEDCILALTLVYK